MQQTLESQARIENIEESMSVTKNFDETNIRVLRKTETGQIRPFRRFLNDLTFNCWYGRGDHKACKSNWWLSMLPKEKQIPCLPNWYGRGSFPFCHVPQKGQMNSKKSRLAYVGITRVGERFFSLPSLLATRYAFGKTSYNRPSRFLREISDDLLQYQV